MRESVSCWTAWVPHGESTKPSHAALGHVRLSIRDLSQAGAQPMHSSDGSIHVVVNGELYDYPSHRAALEARGRVFTSTSDSELALHLYAEHGPDFLASMRGEFSVVLYDAVQRTVLVARDRYGIKPLYWALMGGRVLIAAEIKALTAFDGWTAEWDIASLRGAGWCYDARTVFKGVRKVKAGEYTVFDLDGGIESKRYWTSNYPSKHAVDPRTFDEMVTGVRERLVDAIRCRLAADVPIGVYLSGGIDSSAVAGIATHLIREGGAAMGSEQTQRIKCFTIRFDEGESDESAIAERTARFLDVDYRTMHASESELVRHFEDAVECIEQPANDLNFVGKYMLSEFVKQQGYSVVLTGEGADETHAGYSLFLADYLKEQDVSAPTIALSEEVRRKKLAEVTRLATDPTSQRNAFQPLSHDYASKHKLSSLIGDLSYPVVQPNGLWDGGIFAPWTRELGESNPVLTSVQALDVPTRTAMKERWHPLHSALYLSVKGPMDGIVLTSLGDRCEMGHSIESRPSFLDHHLTGYVNDLPPAAKITIDAEGKVVEKYVLREAAKPFITDELYKRTKHPYSAPIQYTKESEVFKLFAKYVTRDKLEQLGFVDVNYATKLLDLAFERGQADAFRQVLVLAELVVLHERFVMRKVEPVWKL